MAYMTKTNEDEDETLLSEVNYNYHDILSMKTSSQDTDWFLMSDVMSDTSNYFNYNI